MTIVRLLSTLSLLLALTPLRALAEAPAPPCAYPQIHPRGPVPENLPHFGSEVLLAGLEIESDGRTVGHQVTEGDRGWYVITLDEPLEAGQELRFSYDSPCTNGWPATDVIQVAEARPLPERLGELRVIALEASRWLVGDPLRHDLRLDYLEDETFEPWSPIYRTDVLVDGALYSTDRFQPTTGALEVACNAFAPVVPGAHELQWVARLPGAEATLSSEPIRVELNCDDAIRVRAHTRAPLSAEEAAEEDARAEEAAALCAAGGSPAHATWMLALLAWLAIGRQRNRRRGDPGPRVPRR